MGHWRGSNAHQLGSWIPRGTARQELRLDEFFFGDWKNLECDANFQAVMEYDCAT